MTGRLPLEKDFNWAYLSYPRQQFKKRGWMEFRKDLTEDVPFRWATPHRASPTLPDLPDLT